MTCAICSGAMEPKFSALVLGKHLAQYHYCRSCGFLAARDPHWLEEAYGRAIANADTGLVLRNLDLAPKVASTLFWFAGERGEGRFVDVAGGYGLLTRMMRDLGFDFYWQDKYCENVLAPGFEYRPELGPCRAVTAFEVLEHLTDPLPFIEEALATYRPDHFLFSTELYEGEPPAPERWNYYAFATGQHVAFFQRRTLQKLADRLGLHFASANRLHLFSRQPVDEYLLRMVTGPLAAPLSRYIRFRLGSKTVRDQELMLGISRDGDSKP
ncbi:class I SAM-dependent methyltransferase [Geomonas azotofigens]|uniref:class I SAM-dependent methyltransferase n=1 Tax=Geomonas azotofigens TaxID=2843196 RepID=UPI001C126482|nr:class I SAM-dependent methyltransferase [Geomonas azotofigens]MBU5612538.1 class I SAM-dependent methyltransferase [Geomonas azotofigens]